MLTTNVLAALMGKRTLNSAALVTATHKRFKEAADGTSTREMTYVINKWKARINWRGIYNVKSPPRGGGEQFFVESFQPL